jgi:putative hydrolase of the HAD superfamily
MPLKKYTHLFFDLDNTIWDFNSNSFDALYIALDKLQLLKKIGSYEVFFLIYENVNAELWERYRQGSITKKDLSVQRFEASFEKHGTPLSIGGGVVNEAYLTEMPFQTKLVEGARKVLEYLHGRYDMAIITNGFKEVQYEKIHKSELSKYFRKIFISEEIGAQKPGRKIFEHAIKSMNAPKKSTLMIGDSWEADIVGAMNFGIDQVYYNPKLIRTDPKVNENTIINHNLDIITEGEIPIQYPNQPRIINKKVSTTIISDLHQLISRL